MLESLRDRIFMSFELYTKDGEDAHPGNCKFCGETDLVRRGSRKTKTGVKQLWRCNGCTRRFSNTHRHGKHKDPDAVLRCQILYCQGYSLEQVAEWLRLKKKLRVSTSTLHRCGVSMTEMHCAWFDEADEEMFHSGVIGEEFFVPFRGE